jgi:hypothetical protein
LEPSAKDKEEFAKRLRGRLQSDNPACLLRMGECLFFGLWVLWIQDRLILDQRATLSQSRNIGGAICVDELFRFEIVMKYLEEDSS